VSALLTSALLAVAVPAAKVVAPIIAALGCATLTAVFKIFLRGGLNAVDFMVEAGRELRVIEAMEARPDMTWVQRLEAVADELRAAAVKHGKRVARDQAHFAVMVLLQEYRSVAAVTRAQLGVAP
jgi:hypothetical protein